MVGEAMAPKAKLAGTVQGRSVVAVRADAEADDDGIHRGDYLLVRPEAASPGATVVAVVDGQLSVRRLVCGARGEQQLVPVNPHVLPLVLPAERASILGPLVGVLRQKPHRETTTASRPSRAPEIDPVLRMIDDALDDAAMHDDAGRIGGRARELARDLRSLRECYVGTSVPRLRQALVREAQSCIATLRHVLAAEGRRSA
jgi:hypothetical protein